MYVVLSSLKLGQTSQAVKPLTWCIENYTTEMLASNPSDRSRVPSALPDHTFEFTVTVNQLSSAAWHTVDRRVTATRDILFIYQFITDRETIVLNKYFWKNKSSLCLEYIYKLKWAIHCRKWNSRNVGRDLHNILRSCLRMRRSHSSRAPLLMSLRSFKTTEAVSRLAAGERISASTSEMNY